MDISIYGERRDAYRIFVGNYEGDHMEERPGFRWRIILK
jgi:hypothetical protein